jgi:hypothetical protein
MKSGAGDRELIRADADDKAQKDAGIPRKLRRTSKRKSRKEGRK